MSARRSEQHLRASNAKTVLCKYFKSDGKCPFGKKCTFAHGVAELKRTSNKFKSPCWYFNQGGCTKSADECIYEHVSDPKMRKPLHLQHPCLYYHYRTPLICRRGDKCGGDHSYELTAAEWKHHFPEFEFPGDNYFELYSKSKELKAEDFPTLSSTQPKPALVVGPPKAVGIGAWGKPLSFKESEPEPMPCWELQSAKYDPNRSWADYSDSEPEQDSETCSIPPPQELQQKVSQLSQLLTTNKLPPVDGELKILVTTALKQLLEASEHT